MFIVKVQDHVAALIVGETIWDQFRVALSVLPRDHRSIFILNIQRSSLAFTLATTLVDNTCTLDGLVELIVGGVVSMTATLPATNQLVTVSFPVSHNPSALNGSMFGQVISRLAQFGPASMVWGIPGFQIYQAGGAGFTAFKNGQNQVRGAERKDTAVIGVTGGAKAPSSRLYSEPPHMALQDASVQSVISQFKSVTHVNVPKGCLNT